MIYIYRCRECKFEIEVQQSIHETPTETLELDQEHPRIMKTTGERMIFPCHNSTFYRVWQAPRLNFGFREHHHTREEQFQFKNL